ncbi:hypothetical protein AVEN_70270-1 [Araneus ventricosus]|uniref:Ionotropic glutamate receptor C-terminal domain-containing protein n=1 Tax=Araneus ventricosus TaxID=182803 RepID=A0A4Y2C3K2_ARAVE|nr:hypothetical protein AVEN_70270-1 [Araneus ventricosus]
MGFTYSLSLQKVWLSILLATAVVSVTATLIYQVLPFPGKRGITESFQKYLWAFQLGLIGKDFGDNKRWFIRHVWSSPSFRLLQSMWFTAACLVIMYTYQGAIISAFAADRLKPRVSNIEELLKESKLGISTFKNSYPMAFFKVKRRLPYYSFAKQTKLHTIIYCKPAVPNL